MVSIWCGWEGGGNYPEYSFGIFPAGTELTFDFIPPCDYGICEAYIAEDAIVPYPDNCGGEFDLVGKDGSGYRVTLGRIRIRRTDMAPLLNICFSDISSSDADSVMYMEDTEVKIWVQDACGHFFAQTETPYHIIITSGKEWGYLVDPTTGEYKDSITISGSSFTFSPTNQQPDTDQPVVLRVWADNPSFVPGIKEITVKRLSCLSISYSKPMIHPSERDTITIMQNTTDGAMPYPADQIFNIWMNTDAKYGRLRCIATGEEGSYLYGMQPFEFIAADNIDVDSIVVEIEASVSTGGGVAGSIGIGTKDTLHTGPIMAKKQAATKDIGDVSSEMKRKNIELSMSGLQARLSKVSARKGNEKQQQKLAIDIEQLKAQLAYETAKTPIEKQNALANMKQLAKISSVQEVCKAIVDVTIEKNQFSGFSQNDKAWSDSLYDSTKKTIGDVGCALCNMATVLKLLGYDVTPLTLNTWMVTNHGKNYDYYYKGGGVNWQAVTDYASENIISDPIRDDAGQLHADKNNIGKLIGTPITLDNIDTYLNHGYYIVAEVKNILNNGKEHTHFVRIESKENDTYNIYDPGYRNRTTLASYNNQIYKTIVYIVYK